MQPYDNAHADSSALKPYVSNQQFDTLHKLIGEIPIAMLTTTTADGTLISRPLQTLEFDAEHVLWFATDANSEKAAEIKANPHIGLSYADRRDNSYVSISGPARILRDPQKLDELWTPAMSIFFPQGKEDPDLVLIRVEIERAEYWDGPGTLVGKMLYLAAAAITGNPGVMTENAKIEPVSTF
jgi:general stress protein 26